MTSQGEKIGAALARAVRGTAAAMKGKDPVMYITNLNDVPKVEGLKRDDGWVDMQVQFLIDKKSAGADHVVGWTVLKGAGHIYTDHGDTPSKEGDVVYSPRGCWHGFNNTSNEDVVLVWGWMGAGSIEDSGYEVHPESHK